MNSQNINADYPKIANELFDKVNKPQKMTTMEKISNSSKDFFLEAMMSAEGEEYDRYTAIYIQIINGLSYCTD